MLSIACVSLKNIYNLLAVYLINGTPNQGYYYKDEQSMIIWKIGFTLDFGIISLIICFGVHIPTLLKPHAGGHLPYSNIKIRKLNTPTIFKIMCECSSLYIITL